MSVATESPRPLRWYEYAIALTPFALAFTGAIGLAVGPAACALNLALMRSSASLAIRIAAALAISVLGFFAWAVATMLLV